MKEIIEVRRDGKIASKVVVGSVITCLKSFLPEKRIIVITDANVHRRYKDLINQYDYILVGMGETNKTLQTVEKVYRELVGLNVDRECFILGMGGGIVTDMAGFVASTYMRGLDFGFVATTLLSQVDASIGGKNGVNLDEYKNMVGTFNQPAFVLCDPSVLRTLPEREFRGGLAEIIKTAVIGDPALFSLLESHTLSELRSDDSLLSDVITASVCVKAAVVETDEREAGERKKLNLGHTFAHAIEKISNAYTHGEAVGVGMSMICDLSVGLGMLSPVESNRIKELLVRMGLSITTTIDPKQLVKAMSKDKKRSGDKVNLIVIRSIGNCEIFPMTFAELQERF